MGKKIKKSLVIKVWKVIQFQLYDVNFIIMTCSDQNNLYCKPQVFGNVVVWAKWQIVIPSEVRKILNLNSGDNLVVTVKHDKIIWLIKSSDL